MRFGNFLVVTLFAAVAACSGTETTDETDQRGQALLPPPGTASEATRQANAAFGASLPLDDQQDFDDARRGFLAAIEVGIIRDETGAVVRRRNRRSGMSSLLAERKR